MDHLGRVVEQAADAMAAEIAHHAVAELLGMALDRMADIAQAVAGFRGLDAEHHALIGHFDQLLRLQGDIAGQIGPVRIAVPAVEQGRHVDIDDIAVADRLGPRNAVADDMVHADAAAMRVTAIAQGRGHRAAGDRHVVDDAVDLLGRHARHDMGGERVQDLGGQPPRAPHALEAFGAVELDGAGAGDGFARHDRLILGHLRYIDRSPRLCEGVGSGYGSAWPNPNASGPPPCW